MPFWIKYNLSKLLYYSKVPKRVCMDIIAYKVHFVFEINTKKRDWYYQQKKRYNEALVMQNYFLNLFLYSSNITRNLLL